MHELSLKVHHYEFQAMISEYIKDCCAVCFEANLPEGHLICDDCLEKAMDARRKHDSH